MSASPRRARTVEELKASMSGFITAASLERALRFVPRPDDVIVCTYPKSGTTWLQQIVHGLRSGGSMAFDEITEVVPWLELAHDMGMDPDGPQVASPRVYKSHLDYEQVPKGGRYINAIRDPGDVLMSMYRFFDGWRMEPGSISIESFALEFFLRREGSRSYWHHLMSWWRQRRRHDVLLLCYEDMQEDLAGTVARIARFADIDVDASGLALAERQARLDFMKRHERQFDDHLVREARDADCGLPAGGHSTKVATGKVGASQATLSAAVREALKDAWRHHVTVVTGLADYSALRRALNAERRESH